MEQTDKDSKVLIEAAEARARVREKARPKESEPKSTPSSEPEPDSGNTDPEAALRAAGYSDAQISLMLAMRPETPKESA